MNVEAPRTLSWLISELEGVGMVSRDAVTLAANGSSAQALASGTVLGKVTASGKYVILAPGASDGSQNAAAILVNPTTVSASADYTGAPVINWSAAVMTSLLQWPAGITNNQIAAALAQLAALGIKARSNV